MRDLLLFRHIHWGWPGTCALTIGLTGVVLTYLSLRALSQIAE